MLQVEQIKWLQHRIAPARSLTDASCKLADEDPVPKSAKCTISAEYDKKKESPGMKQKSQDREPIFFMHE